MTTLDEIRGLQIKNILASRPEGATKLELAHALGIDEQLVSLAIRDLRRRSGENGSVTFPVVARAGYEQRYVLAMGDDFQKAGATAHSWLKTRRTSIVSQNRTTLAAANVAVNATMPNTLDRKIAEAEVRHVTRLIEDLEALLA